MLFPPPWFSPLGTPLSEAPPSKRKSARGENPSWLHSVVNSLACHRFAGGTQHGSLSVSCRRPWPERIPNSVEYDGPGIRSILRVAVTTPPLSQSPQPPRNGRHTGRFDKLSPECLPFCFGGQGRSATGTLAAHTAAASPRNASGGKPLNHAHPHTLKTPAGLHVSFSSSQAPGANVTSNPAPGCSHVPASCTSLL